MNEYDGTVEIEKPIGEWIFKQNIVGTQTNNGVFFHYSEVCTLLKRMKLECEAKTSSDICSNCEKNM